MKILKNKFVVLLGIMVVLVILVLGTFRDYGKTWDEDDTIALGNHALSLYTTLGKDNSYFSFYPQAAFYLTRGPAVELVRAAITSVAQNNSYEFYHLLLALFALSGVVFLYLTAYELTKSIPISTVSALLLITLPRFYGNMFFNSKDIAPLYFLIICIYLSVLILKGKRNIWLFVLTGVMFGIKASIRITQIYAYPLFVVFFFIQEFFIEKKTIKIILLHQAIIGFFYFLALHVFQPYLLTHPIFGVMQMVVQSNSFPQQLDVLFDGIIYNSTKLPWQYLPKFIVVTTPLVSICLFFLGCIWIVLKRRTVTLLYVLFLFWVPLIYGILFHPVLYDTWRHFFFLYAPLTVIATIGFWQTQLFVRGKWRIVLWVLLSIGMLLPIKDMIALHPYEYVYFNEIHGGIKNAYMRYEVDYWGESFMEATRWINAHKKEFASNDGITYVSPCIHDLAVPYLDKGVKIADEHATVYYCIDRPFLRNPGFSHVVHQITRDGAVLNTIYTK